MEFHEEDTATNIQSFLLSMLTGDIRAMIEEQLSFKLNQEMCASVFSGPFLLEEWTIGMEDDMTVSLLTTGLEAEMMVSLRGKVQ
jgi:hypothetical protein